MRNAANRINDDLQEQLEIQDDLVKSVYHHNVETLDVVREFIGIQSDFFDDVLVREAIESNQNRVQALSKLEKCVHYQDDTLFANMNSYVDLLVSQALNSSSVASETITTVPHAEF